MKPAAIGSLFPTPLVIERHRDAYIAEVGVDRNFSRQEVPALTGFEQSTCDGYAQGRRQPALSSFLALCRLFGARYAARVMSMAGLGVYALEPGRTDLLEVNAGMAAGVAQFATYLQDGRIDHRERLEALPMIRDLHRQLGDVLAQHDAPALKVAS
jgi:hypothetical protein